MLRWILLVTLPLVAEIEYVSFVLRAAGCDEVCYERLETRLLALPGVRKVEVQPDKESVTCLWDPTQPFEYRPLANTIRRTGPGILSFLFGVNISVRGLIKVHSTGATLESFCDGTKFELLSLYKFSDPADQELQMKAMAGDRDARTQFIAIVPQNLSQFHLSKEQRAQLQKKEEERVLVLIKGSLLQPERQPTNYLVITEIK